MKKAILIGGIPGSGKTTLAKTYSMNIYNHLEEYKEKDIVLDDISNFVKDINEIFPYLKNVKLVVITDPFLNIDKNMEFGKTIFEKNGFKVECIKLDISIEEAKKRIEERNDNRIIGDDFINSLR